MVAVFKDIETQALALPERERSALVARLLDSLDSVFDDSPEAVERAWDEEIARRIADCDAGKTPWNPIRSGACRNTAPVAPTFQGMKTLFQPAALEEFREAIVWYRQMAGLRQARALDQEINAKLNLVKEHPLLGTPGSWGQSMDAVETVPVHPALPRAWRRD